MLINRLPYWHKFTHQSAMCADHVSQFAKIFHPHHIFQCTVLPWQSAPLKPTVSGLHLEHRLCREAQCHLKEEVAKKVASSAAKQSREDQQYACVDGDSGHSQHLSLRLCIPFYWHSTKSGSNTSSLAQSIL